MFNNRELIEHYILWERVFEIFVTDKDYEGFSKFAKRIKEAIDELKYEPDPKDLPKSDVSVAKIQKGLYIHLASTFNRVLSLL
ncbi:MAG: hypothetical protein LBD23_16990, partial [Oscillospiraceae bacterium]|nr:hypothetical protein [Oscillospiraceae bacterium]